MTLFGKVLELLAERDATDITVFGGGIIPEADIGELERMGVARIFTPGATTREIVDWVNAEFGAVAGITAHPEAAHREAAVRLPAVTEPVVTDPVTEPEDGDEAEWTCSSIRPRSCSRSTGSRSRAARLSTTPARRARSLPNSPRPGRPGWSSRRR